MEMKKMDYYDDINKYPDITYSKLNGDQVISKMIRLPANEAQNWDVKAVHAFLQNKPNLDTQLLKKLLIKFVDLEVNLENTTLEEDNRIMELIKECQLI